MQWLWDTGTGGLFCKSSRKPHRPFTIKRKPIASQTRGIFLRKLNPFLDSVCSLRIYDHAFISFLLKELAACLHFKVFLL